MLFYLIFTCLLSVPHCKDRETIEIKALRAKRKIYKRRVSSSELNEIIYKDAAWMSNTNAAV